MAYSKFITILLLLGFSSFIVAGHEFYEARELMRQRLNSPRRTQQAATQTQNNSVQAEENYCWGFLSCFCSLLQYAGNSSPYPLIRAAEERRNK